MELKDRKRRETNIVVFNLPEHNFTVGLENKHADEADIRNINTCLGQEILNIVTLFRLGRRTETKIRTLKIVLDSKDLARKCLLDNEKYIEEKALEEFKRVTINRDMTNVKRSECKAQRSRNQHTRQPKNQ